MPSRLGAMVVLCLLCLVSVCAPQSGERCEGEMARVARVINANPDVFAPTVPDVGPGDLVVDFAGPDRRIGIVVRSSPTTQTMVNLLANLGTFGSVTWTPGGAGTGDATLSGAVVNSSDLTPATAATVEVSLSSSGTINAVTVGAGGIQQLALISGTQALVRVELAASGLFSLAIDGTTGATMRWTVTILQPSSGEAVGNPEVLP